MLSPSEYHGNYSTDHFAVSVFSFGLRCIKDEQTQGKRRRTCKQASPNWSDSATGGETSTAYRILGRLKEIGSIRRRQYQGRPRDTSVRDDRFTILTVLRGRFQTSVELRNLLRRIRHVPKFWPHDCRIHEAGPIKRFSSCHGASSCVNVVYTNL